MSIITNNSISPMAEIYHKESFDKICKITSAYNNIKIYIQGNHIVVEGPVYADKKRLPIECLRNLIWNEIPLRTLILFKHFTIDVRDAISSACATYMVEHFGSRSIALCELVQYVSYKKEGQEGLYEGYTWVGHGCGFCGYLGPFSYDEIDNKQIK